MQISNVDNMNHLNSMFDMVGSEITDHVLIKNHVRKNLKILICDCFGSRPHEVSVFVSEKHIIIVFV